MSAKAPEAKIGAGAAPPRGHEADVIDTYRVPTILAVALIALGAELFIIQQFMAEQFDLAILLSLHGLVVALLITFALLYRPDGHWQRLAVLLPVITASFGPFGPIGMLIITMVHKIFRQTSVRFADWYLELFPEEKDEIGRTLYDTIVSGRADSHASTSVSSFTDVLRTGTLEQKQAVITLLTRHFRPAFAPALQLALRDLNPVVRVQAATAAAEIENDFAKESERLKQQMSERPRDIDSVLRLARHYDDYAFCGLLDTQREADYRGRALELYFTAIGIEPANADVKAAISRILVREGEYNEAVHYLGERLEGGEVNRSLVLWYAESLFYLRRYDELRGLIRRFGPLFREIEEDQNSHRVALAATYWQDAIKRDNAA